MKKWTNMSAQSADTSMIQIRAMPHRALLPVPPLRTCPTIGYVLNAVLPRICSRK
jgi:hypothetical protein